MKVQFRQSGGFAGQRRGCDLDTAQLTDSDRLELNRLVQNADVGASLKSHSAEARDVELYDVLIKHDDRQVVLQIDEASLTQELAPLIEFLQARSGPRALDDDIQPLRDE